ncbi:hemerythrin domain-containing protein [Rhizobiales bacterium]|uniref:hemerythrin domain-containing protein n=1 Tax=Hongsoonwoonella zoysiae TaxID=2821844 RepID=UPI0015617BA8|nr:hemerythrin domain-containing protein [Hongsoonwoonella zoysiae]NRG17118.1 hemerythrin domain-containing protein [Hongsoonwoonella zoysiae]
MTDRGDTETALESRTGLPEELRVLAQALPRADWPRHANFDGLTRFWLERHVMFREVLSRIAAETDAFSAGDMEARSYGQRLSRLAGFFVQQLHEHHHIEDAHYFPELERLDERLKRGFAILDLDHHSLDRSLRTFAADTNEVLDAIRDGGAAIERAKAYRDEFAPFERMLVRHLEDEEEIIVPLLLKYGG